MAKDVNQQFNSVEELCEYLKAQDHEETMGADITTTSANKEEILEAGKNIYKDYPELLKAIEEIFK